MKNFFKTLGTVALDMVYPRHCAVCNRTIGGITDVALCKACSSKTFTPKVVRSDEFAFDEAIAMLRYDGSTRDAMIRYKFKSIGYYGSAYAHVMSQAASERPYLADALMCCVPISRTRDRRYSQTKVIAAELAAMWGSDFVPDLLQRTAVVSQISKMKLFERLFFIKGSIGVNPLCDVYGRSVVVIDDIYTSGTTANECARVLKSYGADKVYVLCPCYD